MENSNNAFEHVPKKSLEIELNGERHLTTAPIHNKHSHATTTRHDVTAPIPDGGWGWLVCASSFTCMLILDGMLFSFGVFYIELLDYFQASRSKTALIGSLFMGMSMMGGPLASSLVNLFGVRKIAACGAVLSFVAFGSSVLAPSVDVLALTYGFFGGLGICMVYIPAVLVIGFYFDKRRGLANGLAASGSGVGALIYPPLCTYLQDEYTWKGATLILAAIALNLLVCSAVFIPPQPRHHGIQPRHRSISGAESDDKTDEKDDVFLPEKIPTDSVTLCDTVNYSFVPPLGPHQSHTGTDQNLLKPQDGRFTFYKYFDAHLYNSVPKLPLTSEHESVDKTYNSVGNLGPVNSALSSSTSSRVKRRLHENYQPLRALDRQDIFYSGSIARLPDYGRLSTIDSTDDEDASSSSTSSMTSPSHDVTSDRQSADCLRLFRKSLNKVIGINILSNPVFIGIVCYHLLWTTHSTVLTILPTKAMQHGIGQSDAALLLSVIGFTNILGRMLVGVVADRVHGYSVWIVSAALALGAVTCLCIPFSVSYTHFIIEAAVFGFAMATWTSLRPVVLVELLGIEHLTNSFGLLALFQGIAFCAGPPLAGLIIDYTNSCTVPFLLCAAAFCLSAIICLPLPRLAKHYRAPRHRDSTQVLQLSVDDNQSV